MSGRPSVGEAAVGGLIMLLMIPFVIIMVPLLVVIAAVCWVGGDRKTSRIIWDEIEKALR